MDVGEVAGGTQEEMIQEQGEQWEWAPIYNIEWGNKGKGAFKGGMGKGPWSPTGTGYQGKGEGKGTLKG